ncbi:MAG TPA: hypothetical protein VJ385_01055 [Fibrobacteria bacterium]|nr:hypothetical protein [Fibrobacteria bacterium]
MLGRLLPESLADAKALVGMARLEDGGFAVGYAKDSPHSGAAYEFWVTRVDAKGARIFSTLIFGSMDKNLVDAKGEPGVASSGRLVYNKATKKICAYVGHTMKWDDGVRHQGGHVSFLNLEGVNMTSDGWYFSHNFDMRLMVVGNSYYTLAHGDAYPRALGFAKWSDGGATAHTKGKREFGKDFLRIPGATGDNKTSTQLGNFVSFADGTFGVVFATANGRNNFDVGYRQLSSTGDTLNLTWLTSHPANTLAIFPRIAKYGSNVLVLWEQAVGNVNNGIQTAVVAPNGTIVAPAAPLPDKALRLSPYHEVINLPDGSVLWANQKGSDSVSVFRIAAPSSPVLPPAPARAPAVELRVEAGRILLVARDGGLYRVRQYNAPGRVLAESQRSFGAGLHALSAPLPGAAIIEVEAKGEKAYLDVSAVPLSR